MFDFSWSEIGLIAVVALVLIGPKDMPVAIRAVSAAIRKLRRMAGEFQQHVDEMLREADLHEVRSTMNDLRRMNLRSTIENAIDPDRALPRRLDDPFHTHPVPPVRTLPETPIPDRPTHAPQAPSDTSAPAFIPPMEAIAPAPPAFVPPRDSD